MIDFSSFIKDDGSLNMSKLTKSATGKHQLKLAAEKYGEARPAQLAYRVIHNIDQLPNCKTCSKQLTASNFIDFSRGYRTYCSNSCSSRKDTAEFKTKLENFSSNLKLFTEQIKHCTDIVEVKNERCGHTFNVIYRNIFTNDNYCPTCGGKQRAKIASRAILDRSTAELERLLPLVGTNYSTYLKVVRILTAKTYVQNIEKLNPNRLPLSRYAYNLDHIVPILECYRNRIDVHVAASIENLSVITAKANLSKKAKMIPEGEKLLNAWIEEQKFINTNVNQLYFDQYLEELNGLVKAKLILLDNKQQLVHGEISIFEDEWLWKQKIVKSRLLAQAGLAKRIYARKCKIVEVSSEDATRFCEESHIQGSVQSSVRYGLSLEDKLVALMTFGKPRFNKQYEWELLRYCTTLNSTIVGGASKILAHFKKLHTGNLISYADRRWSTGNLYKTLGFTELTASPPSYFYVDQSKKVRINRVRAQKHKLSMLLGDKFDPALTEAANMSAAGFARVYDCGNLVFSLS